MVPFLRRRIKTAFGKIAPARKSCIYAPQGIVSITFDDFPRSSWSVAGDILASRGAKATFYVSGSLCGRKIGGQEYFNASDLKELSREGHEAGCHTYDHISAANSNMADFSESIEKNGLFLKDITGQDPTTFAYPYGDLSWAAVAEVSKRFVWGRTSLTGRNVGFFEAPRLKAVPLEEPQLWRPLLAQVARERSWLILLAHDVSDFPSRYGCQPKHLRALMCEADLHGLAILPVREVAKFKVRSFDLQNGS